MQYAIMKIIFELNKFRNKLNIKVFLEILKIYQLSFNNYFGLVI